MTRFRPILWRQLDLYGALVVSCIPLAVALASHSQALLAVAIDAALIGVVVRGSFRASIDVSEDRVTITDVAGRPLWAPRESIREVRVYSYWILLVDSSGTGVLRLRPLWSRQQLADLAALLGVPLTRIPGRLWWPKARSNGMRK